MGVRVCDPDAIFLASFVQRASASLPPHTTTRDTAGVADGRSSHAYAIDARPARTATHGYLGDHVIRLGN